MGEEDHLDWWYFLIGQIEVNADSLEIPTPNEEVSCPSQENA